MNKSKHQYHLHMGDAEKKELDRLCEKTALSRAEVLRKLIMSKPLKERPHADFTKLIYEIDKIGVNFNQLVHKVNTVGYATSEDVSAARIAFDRVHELLRSWESTWR